MDTAVQALVRQLEYSQSVQELLQAQAQQLQQRIQTQTEHFALERSNAQAQAQIEAQFQQVQAQELQAQIQLVAQLRDRQWDAELGRPTQAQQVQAHTQLVTRLRQLHCESEAMTKQLVVENTALVAENTALRERPRSEEAVLACLRTRLANSQAQLRFYEDAYGSSSQRS